MELSVEQKNAELTLENIRRECLQEGAFLKRIYEDQARVNAEIKLARENFDLERIAFEEERLSLEKERLELVDRKNVFTRYETTKNQELTIVKEQIHQAMKELSKLNGWVSTAEDRQRELMASEVLLQEQIDAKYALLSDLEDIKVRQKAARKELADTKEDSALIVLSTNETLTVLRQEVGVLETRKVAAIAEREQAEIERNHMVDEKERVSHDLEIYIQRIEAKHGEYFPELRMKL